MQFCSILAVFHSIVKNCCKENMVCINSPSKLPMFIEFWWKERNSWWIWLIFAIFWFFEQFCKSILAVFWGLNASQIPNYNPCHQKSSWQDYPEIISPKTTNFLIIFAFHLLSQKSMFCIFEGPKTAPLRLRDLKTSGYGTKPLNIPSGRGISPKWSLFKNSVHICSFLGSGPEGDDVL